MADADASFETESAGFCSFLAVSSIPDAGAAVSPQRSVRVMKLFLHAVFPLPEGLIAAWMW